MNRTTYQTVNIHENVQTNAKSDLGIHWVLINLNGQCHQHREYRGYSNTMMHDECKFLDEKFPKNLGYNVLWQ